MTDHWPRYFVAVVDPAMMTTSVVVVVAEFDGWRRCWMKLPFRWPVSTQCTSDRFLPVQNSAVHHLLLLYYSYRRLLFAFAAAVEIDTAIRN